MKFIGVEGAGDVPAKLASHARHRYAIQFLRSVATERVGKRTIGISGAIFAAVVT